MQQAEFQALWGQYAAVLRRSAFAIIRHHHDAEDVLQNVFLKAWLHGDDLSYAWLRRVVYTECMDYLRRKPPVQRLPEEWGTATQPIEKWLQGQAIAAIVEKLPEKQKNIFVLHYVGGYGIEKIGRGLNLSSGTVKAQLSRARARLKKIYNCAN